LSRLKTKRCKTFDIKTKNKNKAIDGQAIEVEPGTTLQAARMIGGESVPPAMCYSKLEGSGGKCRCCCLVAKGSDADSDQCKTYGFLCNRMHGRNGGQQQIFG
jgi:predicted molibdopterin-dependent oxidoreductase YjgC